MTLPAEPRLPPPSPDAGQHSQRLAEHIAETIAREGDWIPFSRFMELALYAPGLGYYAAGARKFGAEGDFVTAPEISPVFARCLARQARQVLEATGGNILELGPGSGALAADLFAELLALGTIPSRYRLLEVSPDLRERQQALVAARFPEHRARFEWLDALPDAHRGLLIANEVLDVVPVALVHRDAGGRLEERGVIVTEAGFAFEDRPLGDRDLERRAQAVFPPGDYEYLSEVSLAAEALVRTVARSLEAGLALFIDYGFAEREFYHPQRSMGTLRCHYRHRFHGDPFFMPGLQDITAHVDFSAMARAAESADAEVYGYTTQAYFLISCGLAEVIGSDASGGVARLKETSAAQRLVSPAEMGELFKVLGFGRGMDEPLVGFQSARHLAL